MMMEEAEVAIKSAAQAHHATAQALHALYSCRAMLMDSTVKNSQYWFKNLLKTKQHTELEYL